MSIVGQPAPGDTTPALPAQPAPPAHPARRHVLLGGGLVFGAALAASPAAQADPGHAAQPTSAHGSRHAREWVQAVYDLTWRDDVATTLGTTPPNAARCYAYVMLAMYEAVAAGDSRLRSAGGQLHGLGTMPKPRGRIDWPVAMAESAHATTFVVHGRMAPQRLALITVAPGRPRRRAPGRRRPRADDREVAGPWPRRRGGHRGSGRGRRLRRDGRPAVRRRRPARASGSRRRPTTDRPSSPTGRASSPSS